MKRRIRLYTLYGAVILVLFSGLTYVDKSGLHVYTGLVELISLIIAIVSYIAGRFHHANKESDTCANQQGAEETQS